MQSALIIGVGGIVIALVSIGLLFWVYSDIKTEFMTTSNELKDKLDTTESELNKTRSTLAEARTQLIILQDKIKTLTSTNQELLQNLSSLEGKISLLEGRLAILENSVGHGNVIAPPGLPIFSGKAIIYGQVLQGSYGFNATERLLATGMDVEYRNMPINNLENADIVLLLSFDWDYRFSADEIGELQAYVLNGGRLIIAVDTDYSFCDPPSGCSMEVARNFGFAFGDDIDGVAVPAPNESKHPIWAKPNSMSSAIISFDAYVTQIIDTDHVRVLGLVDNGVSQVAGQQDPRNKAAIVVNENPAYNGGKVLGTGYNLLLGVNGDFRMFDNILSFMLS